MFVSLLNWLTFAWLLILTIASIRQIVKGQRHSVYWVIPVLFLFCGLPLLLDETIGHLNYNNEPGFALASADELTNILYCLYIAVVPVIWLWVGKSKVNSSYPMSIRTIPDGFAMEVEQLNVIHRVVLFAMLVCPLLMVLFSSYSTEYLTFYETARFTNVFEPIRSYISIACFLAIMAGCYLLAKSPPLIYGRWPSSKSVILLAPWMLIAVWINGKRGAVAVLAFLLILALRHRGVLRGLKTYILLASSLIIVLTFSVFYQFHSERLDTTLYENARIDFGRDHTIKMTIFAELHPETMRILEYRGQSILFNLIAFIPRKLWPEKPLLYAQYFTSAMFLVEPQPWDWGMTTCWLEEAIANFSWLGMLIGPLLMGIIFRAGDSTKSSLARILTPLIATLFLVVQLSAFAPLFLVWFLGVVRNKWRLKFRLRWWV